jgi:phage major head subunit gpT-like protein
MPPLSMRADIGPRSINDEARTADLILTTVAGVRRRDWWTGEEWIEVLSMDPAHVRLERINGGAPLLDSHNAFSTADILGTVVPGSVSVTKKAMLGSVRFSKRDAVEEIWKDVKDGIIRDVSIGYRIHKFEESIGKDNKIPIRTAIDWEPFEASLVPIPADPGAKVRGAEPADANPCEIVTRGAERIAPAEPVKSEPPVPEKQPAKPGVQKEPKMSDNDRSETIAEPRERIPAPPAETEPNERDTAVAMERARVQGIRSACLAARLPRSFEDELITKGVALVDAQSRVFDELRKREDPNPRVPEVNSGSSVMVGDDPLVHKRASIERALCHRIDPQNFKLGENDREYRGLSLMDVAEIFLRARGVRLTGMTSSERAAMALGLSGRGGMHTTSDFPLLLADVANKVLRAAYEEAPQTWRPIARPVNLTDFKASKQLQVGEAPQLLEVLEHGEFTAGTITEAREQIQLKTYGRLFAITRQSLINDDTGAFGQLPAAFGRSARTLENTLAWAQITSNPTMGDSVALFDAAGHANYTASGTAISVDSLGVARKALRNQKGLDGATPLNLTARYLIVPAAKETIADQFVTQITPAQGTNVNPFTAGGRTPLTVIVEPMLDATSATAWYMATDAASLPILLYGTLDGQGGPTIEQRIGFEVDGVQIKCRHDIAFKAADWHGIYLNAGA